MGLLLLGWPPLGVKSLTVEREPPKLSGVQALAMAMKSGESQLKGRCLDDRQLEVSPSPVTHYPAVAHHSLHYVYEVSRAPTL